LAASLIALSSKSLRASSLRQENAHQVEAHRTILFKAITSYDDPELSLKVEPLFRHTIHLVLNIAILVGSKFNSSFIKEPKSIILEAGECASS
jgi:hypothetical protein